MNIWAINKGNLFIKPLVVEPWRVVEAQHILSARDLVDSQEEHDLLEEMIEESKPLIEKDTNYLLFTPFRYPPLKYGSRFASTLEPSLWYGSLELTTAFTEVAYYRLQFFNDTKANLGYIEISMTAFRAFLSSNKGIDLTQEPFNHYLKEISNKNSHHYSQLLGNSMREEGVDAFLYYSARTKKLTSNVAAFTPAVFQRKKNHYITSQQNWKCLTNKHLIEFTRLGILAQSRVSFSQDDFL